MCDLRKLKNDLKNEKWEQIQYKKCTVFSCNKPVTCYPSSIQIIISYWIKTGRFKRPVY